jgi:lysophospholipase L1-like esterase
MTARGRFGARLVTMLIALAGFVTVVALPAAAANSGTVQYVALGDSYAAGQGGGGDTAMNCQRSPNGYPNLLDSKMRIDLLANLACTGATTSEVSGVQLPQLSELNEEKDIGLVTLTVGAADLGLSAVLTSCTAVPPVNCQAAIAQAVGQLAGLRDRLIELYAAVADEAPNALIVVTGYPYLFGLPTPGCDQTVDVICAINNATTALNVTIQQAVEAQPDRVNIVYVDVTAAFAGHGIGSEEPFIHDRLTDDDPPRPDPDAFHPNAAGYRAYAKAIFAAIRGAWLDDKKHAA